MNVHKEQHLVAPRDTLRALSADMRRQACENAQSRYAREAKTVETEQLQVRWQQLVVTCRRLRRELEEAGGASPHLAQKIRFQAEDTQAQLQALDTELSTRSESCQIAFS